MHCVSSGVCIRKRLGVWFIRSLGGTRVLVTGGAGFMGSHLIEALLDADVARVAVVDNFFLGKEENLEVGFERQGAKLEVYREDAADQASMTAVFEAEGPEIVFNLATRALRYSFFNPTTACRMNLDVALVLAELLRRGAYRRLVHVSSSEVYGSSRSQRMDENHPWHPTTPYAAGKAAADLLLSSYVQVFDLDIVILRPFNNYGPRQSDGEWAGIVPQTIRRIRSGEPPVISGDGNQTRDFMFVRDTARAFVELSERELPGGTTINIGSGDETSINEIAAELCDATGYEGPIMRTEPRVADVTRHCADVRQVTRLIGPVAKTTLADGIRATVAWFDGRRKS